jgi:hypothetical protein
LLAGGMLALLACGTRQRGTMLADAGGGDGGASGGSGGGGISSTGGVGEGGIDGTGGLGPGGGAGGAGGGTTAPPTTCAGNADCSGDRAFCEPATKQCVPCVASADCPSGGHCLGNQCVSFTACNNSRDCSDNQVCDPGRGICVECASPTDCTGGQICILNKCVTVTTCQASSDCGAQLCDTTTQSCVNCLTDAECAAGTQHCVAGGCRKACTSDKECTDEGLLCDTATSTCVVCKAQTDCPASSNCAGGTCQADICDEGQSTCSGDGVFTCNEAGNGWVAAGTCSAAQGCVAYGGVASCGGSPTDAGPPPTDAAVGCSSATMAPCTGIPQFTGTQTLDGMGDDLCSLPSFQFGVENAQVNNNYNNIPNSQFETVTAQVGWTQAGIVAFFDVKDTSVQTVNMKDAGAAIDKAYQGDSIELFISSSDNLTGLTASDNNALHITVPANGPGVVVKTSGGGSAAHTAMAAAQYAQSTTSTGYAIELKLPWPGGAAPSAGAKVRFDLALNSADTNCSGVDDMRDAQLVFYVGQVGNTSCPSGADAWCDDRTWCSTTLQ